MKFPTCHLLLIFGLSIFFSCNKNNDPVNDPDQIFYNSLCASSNGTLNLEIDGKKWDASCAIATEIYNGLFGPDSLLLSVVSYTGDGIYLNDGSFEWFHLALIISNGPGTYSLSNEDGAACYYAGIFDWTNDPNGPAVNVTEETIFCTDYGLGETNQITIESIQANRIKGHFDLIAHDQNGNGETLNLRGEFDVDHGK